MFKEVSLAVFHLQKKATHMVLARRYHQAEVHDLWAEAESTSFWRTNVRVRQPQLWTVVLMCHKALVGVKPQRVCTGRGVV